ncbi:hypothetical protein SAMN05518672_1011435 [Chitinophaga sp. CF118]|uniref:hypothetical protein n=1 Tax=Chitinophaga sp. CF118 TaxID=1884367 RepID=UPI0008E3DF04|nr:hypothetical protein [Chitinophaga sp. CF118]SFD28279.1 hypothetical protein SAMN05518672_1011435 [Chitinophaga sp. CF118]
MQQKSIIQRHWKKVLLAIGVTLLLILTTTWYLGQRWNRQIRLQLRSYVREMSDSLYTLQYADLNLNLLTGSLSLYKVSLVRDSAIYEKLRQQQKAPKFLYSLSADQVDLRYFKVLRYFRHKEISAGALELQNPSIVLELNAQNIDTTKPRNAYQNISKKIQSLFLSSLLLDNINLKYTYIKKDSSLVVTQLSQLRVHVKDFLIDSVAMQDPTRFLYAHNYEFNLKEYRYRTPDSLYWIHVRDIDYSAAEQILRVGQFSVEPRYSKPQFDVKAQTQRDRFDVQLNNIELSSLQPRLLLEQQVFWANKLTISSGKLDIYRNRGLPMPPGNKLGQFPNQLLQKLAIPIYIDTLMGKKTELSYTEANPKSHETGKITFNHVHGTLRNITNIDSMIAKNGHIRAEMDAILMQSGKLRAHFDFAMKDSTGRFGVSGQIMGMDARELNPVLKPLGMIEVKSCRINEVTFSMTGNERSASGEVKFLYSDLKINILKKQEGSHDYQKKGLMSLFANVVVIKDNNPDNGETRIAHPHFTRDIQKSFFNLVWKTLFTGIKETALGKNSPI